MISMKPTLAITAILLVSLIPAPAEQAPNAGAVEESPAEASSPAADEDDLDFDELDEAAAPEVKRAKHLAGSNRVADDQDELKADVQQLIVEQTIPKVIELLTEVEDIMNEATDLLAEADTGGTTIAAQTEIIEKIHEAAKERQSQGGAGQSGGAMMDMMERMMGKNPGGEPKGQGEGDKPGSEGGQGQTGESDAANENSIGAGGGDAEKRRIPKAGGTAGREIPEEFKRAFDAYNRGAEQKAK
jgi:hypothetical protein